MPVNTAHTANKRLIIATAAAMVLLSYVCKTFFATTLIAPLAAGISSGGLRGLPKLLDATASELKAGLDKGDFSSVDLVNVRFYPIDPSTSKWADLPGIRGSNIGSQCYSAHGHGA